MGRTWTRHTTFPLHPGSISVSNFTASRKHSVGMGMHHHTASRICTTPLLALPGFCLSVFFLFFSSPSWVRTSSAFGVRYQAFSTPGKWGVPGNWRRRLPFLELRLGGYLFLSQDFLFVQGWERFLVCFILVYGFHVWMCNVVWIYSRLCLIPALVAVTTAVTPGRR